MPEPQGHVMIRKLLPILLLAMGTLAHAWPLAVPPPTGSPPGPRALPEIPKSGRVTIIRIDGTIDLGLAPYVERVVGSLGKDELLVLDVNTLGGRVDAAIVIRDAMLSAKARTVCWINRRAISAGALITLACDVIAVTPGATIGAATPVELGQGGEMKPVEEKVVSYMRKEMGATAKAKGRSGAIAEAMVDADAEVPGLDEKGKLLTLDDEQALAWGIAEIKAAGESELFTALGIANPPSIARPTISWAERIARFLSDPIVSGLLMTLGMLGILIELYSPGHGISLGIGILCLALFFFGHNVVKLAGWEEILLFVVGGALLGFEILVPGHIIPGILGVGAILVALVLALVNLEHIPFEVAWSAGWLTHAIATVASAIVATAVSGWGVAKFLPRTRLGRSMVLDAAIRSVATDKCDLAGFVGMAGEAATDLRPAGKVLLGGARIEATAETGYISSGSPVRVLRVDGSHVVVRQENG